MFFMRYGYAALSICTYYFIMLNSGFWALSLTFDDLICKFTKVPASCPIARSRGTPASKVSPFNLTCVLHSFLMCPVLNVSVSLLSS